MKFTLSDELYRLLMDHRLHTNFGYNGGDLFFIKFHMQGHWQRFKEYIQKHQTDFGYYLLDMYNEPTYNFYIGLTDKLAEKFYLGISDNEIYFNITTRSSVTPVKNSFEYIKNHLDPNAELYIGTRKIL